MEKCIEEGKGKMAEGREKRDEEKGKRKKG